MHQELFVKMKHVNIVYPYKQRLEQNGTKIYRVNRILKLRSENGNKKKRTSIQKVYGYQIK